MDFERAEKKASIAYALLDDTDKPTEISYEFGLVLRGAELTQALVRIEEGAKKGRKEE